MVSSITFIYAAWNVYYELLSQSLYPIIEAIIQWVTKEEYEISLDFTLSKFSLPYTWLILSVVLFIIICYGNIKFFIKLNSYGTIFTIFVISFIVYYGLVSFTNTDFVVGQSVEKLLNQSNINLFKSNFAPLAGMSTLGFCLHNVSLPILKNNKDKENNFRDLFLGYFMTFCFYVVVGWLGYLGFSGALFYDSVGIEKAQNCLNLFPPKHIAAFAVRVALFSQIMLVYPLLFHILSIQISLWLTKQPEMPDTQKKLMYLLLIGINTVLGACYPEVGSVIGLLGSILGLGLMYIIPIAVYLKRYYLEVTTPQLVEALDWNKIKWIDKSKVFETPKIVIYEKHVGLEPINEVTGQSESSKKFRIIYLINDISYLWYFLI